MANTASARKRIRQIERRTERNKSRMSRMRTFIKKVEMAVASGDKDAANVALREAQPEMQRAAGKGEQRGGKAEGEQGWTRGHGSLRRARCGGGGTASAPGCANPRPVKKPVKSRPAL